VGYEHRDRVRRPARHTHEERLQRALAGDESAFAWIVETFSSDMAQVCLVVVGDLELADEAVAAAWPIAWRTLRRLRDPERLRSWLISIAANQARQMARARRRRMVARSPYRCLTSPRTRAIGTRKSI
jgi:DNA-directed RNA polymerase specialized sigma24 family protein